jgi:hypothetical protein
VFFTKELLAEKRRDMGPYVFGAQMLQDPTADEKQGFKLEWLQYMSGPGTHRGHNLVIVVDAASSKKKGSDYTAMWVVGFGPDQENVCPRHAQGPSIAYRTSGHSLCLAP